MPIWHAARRQPPADEKPRMPVRAARGASRRQIMRRYHAGAAADQTLLPAFPRGLATLITASKKNPPAGKSKLAFENHWQTIGAVLPFSPGC